MNWSDKPVIVLGHGVRASGADPRSLLELGVPVISSWQGMDLVDNYHPMYFGRPGIYGQRAANKILYEADSIIAIGCRLTPWMIGHGGLRPEQKLVMVDVDAFEVAKFKQADHIVMDAKDFIELAKRYPPAFKHLWMAQCVSWRARWPWIESPSHDNTDFINSYRLMELIEPLLKPDQIIVTDVGAMMCPVFQSLHVKPPQRILTSGGLGEMGCGLPAAIGASFGSQSEVLCFTGDGGLMMNLQELQTIAFHQLPVKILVFANDGYGMIKGTHKNLKIKYSGVDKASGLSFPDFCAVADSFQIGTCDIKTWDQAARWLPAVMESARPYLAQIHIDPEQSYVPRLQPIIKDGTIVPARFDELSPNG